MKRNAAKCLREELAKKHACYVLITCDESSDSGEMQVEMSYEGDATLAAYMLHGAQLRLHEQDTPPATVSKKCHVHRLE